MVPGGGRHTPLTHTPKKTRTHLALREGERQPRRFLREQEQALPLSAQPPPTGQSVLPLPANDGDRRGWRRAPRPLRCRCRCRCRVPSAGRLRRRRRCRRAFELLRTRVKADRATKRGRGKGGCKQRGEMIRVGARGLSNGRTTTTTTTTTTKATAEETTNNFF